MKKNKNKSLLTIILVLALAAVGLYVANNVINKNIASVPAGATNAACFVSLAINPPVTPTPTPTGTPPVIVCDEKLDIALVIDRSSTMNQRESDGRKKVDWARDAAITFVKALQGSGTTSVKVSVASFGAQGNDGNGELAPEYNSTLNIALTNNFGNVLTALNGVVYKKPGTCIQCGIRIGNLQLRNTDNRRIQILLSDGKANHVWGGDASNQVSIRAAIDESNDGRSKGIEYRVIGYGTRGTNQIDENTLKSIAGSPSNYVYKPNAGQWSEAFLTILKDLCK